MSPFLLVPMSNFKNGHVALSILRVKGHTHAANGHRLGICIMTSLTVSVRVGQQAVTLSHFVKLDTSRCLADGEA